MPSTPPPRPAAAPRRTSVPVEPVEPVDGAEPVERIERLTADGLRAAAPALAALLLDAVRAGASLGFPASLTADEAAAWWRSRAGAVADGSVLVWAAGSPAAYTGTVSLVLEQLPNGRHRAALAKLMVHRTARGRGLGRRLLALAEREAAAAGRSLLVLDTETGSAAEHLYRSAGWTELGSIPGYAAGPAGELRATTVYYKRVAAPTAG